MKIIISIELVINLVLLLLFYIHMFQLNSYFIKRYANYLKININKILWKNASILIVLFLLLINKQITEIISIVVLLILIILNIPKNKAKIPLNFTSRAIRMLITEGLTIIVICILSRSNIILGILNVLSFILCIIANLINIPIESVIRKYYINDAKKILAQMPNLIVIGVTGSYGKTSVKNYLARTLSSKYEVLITPKNYNTMMGVVKTIREELKPIHQIFICEMGATKVGDIKEICDIVKPKYGVITAIGPQHLQSFKTIDNIIKTKFELYDSVNKNGGITFLNYDSEYIKGQNKTNIITYGVDDKKLDYRAYDLKSTSKGLSFLIKDVLFKTTLIGRHNIVNLTVSIAVANYLGISLNRLVSYIREIQSIPHRLQLLANAHFNIIDDSYNSNPISSKMALDTLNEFEGIKIIVTPGLVDLGSDEEKFNFEFGKYMSNICDYIFIVKSIISKYIIKGIDFKKFNKNKLFEVNRPEEAINKIKELNLENVTVLLENDLPDNYNL